MSSATFDPTESLADRVGLDRAYADQRKVYMTGDTLFVAGTSSLGDVADDLALPFGLTKGTQRYIDTERVLKANPKIRRVVGHSLGGAIGLELQKDHPELESRTYGAPVVSMTPRRALQVLRRPRVCLRLWVQENHPPQLESALLHGHRRAAASRRSWGGSRVV